MSNVITLYYSGISVKPLYIYILLNIIMIYVSGS